MNRFIPFTNRKMVTKRAFTLIELLTVIAVVAVMVGILIPAVGSVRAKAQMATSVNNLRQLGAGGLLYANDNGGYYPRGAFTPLNWHNDIYPYVGSDVSVFADPTGYNLDTWVRFSDGRELPFDYGYNAHINPPEGSSIAINPNLVGPRNIYADVNHSSVPWIHTIVSQNNFVHWTFGLSVDQTGVNGHRQAFDPRHNGRGNVLWLDGHVSSLTYAEYMKMAADAGGGVNFCTGRRSL
jgi:prepilin-type processing-associated H-X9-DG protein/prepilin-type N-terminal cleavage/methylation domain-containing protein